MRQSSTAHSPVHPPHAGVGSGQTSLHPVLQKALASLDGSLDEELVRYRRQRALGQGGYTAKGVRPKLRHQPLDLMPTAQPPNPPVEQANVTTDALAGFHPTVESPPLATIAPRSAEPGRDREATGSALELEALAKQYASQVSEESDLRASMHGSPDDYLESSEELLRTLSAEEAEVQAEQGFMHSLLTPLGVGSMLLLLLSSALFGFVIMNPNSISQLFAGQSPEANSRNASNPAQPAADADLPQPNLANQEFPDLSLGTLGSIRVESAPGAIAVPSPGKPSPQPGKPTLAKPTKPTAESSENARVPATAAPSVPAAPRVSTRSAEPAPPVPASRNLAPAAPAYEPAPAPPRRSYSPPPQRSYSPPPAPKRSYVPPAPKRSTPPALPDLPAPQPATSAAPAAKQAQGYKVVVPYTSDRTLEEARQKVPEAYVKNYSDGAKVQLGAYQDEAAAKAQVEELQKQGIPAEVYQP